jgi:hypothetical protein
VPDFPGCVPYAVSIGAVGADDKVAVGLNPPYHLSNSSPVVAPGYGYGSPFDYPVAPIYPGDEETSYAAPFAAGAWTLFTQRYPDVEFSVRLKRFLEIEAVDVIDPRRHGLPSATAAPNVQSPVKRISVVSIAQPKAWNPNVAYDSPSGTGASVTPPPSCDYLTAGQDCTLREAVAAALPQDVISFL